MAHGFFNAVLRDHARLGRLLADDGVWEGNQIIPAQYMIDAIIRLLSSARKSHANASLWLFLWLLPGTRRQFALVGANGRRICVGPTSKLILVQTAVDNTEKVWRLWSAQVEQFGQG